MKLALKLVLQHIFDQWLHSLRKQFVKLGLKLFEHSPHDFVDRCGVRCV